MGFSAGPECRFGKARDLRPGWAAGPGDKVKGDKTKREAVFYPLDFGKVSGYAAGKVVPGRKAPLPEVNCGGLSSAYSANFNVVSAATSCVNSSYGRFKAVFQFNYRQGIFQFVLHDLRILMIKNE